jgi:hypothetical protein
MSRRREERKEEPVAGERYDVGMDQHDKSAQRRMWDEWWYDRFEIPFAIPDKARRIEMEMAGERFGGVLLDHVAPRTCQAFWDALPGTKPMETRRG